METTTTMNPDMSTALPGEMDQNPEELLDNDSEFQDWLSDHDNTTREVLDQDDNFPW